MVSFLQILSSMHVALFLDPDEASPIEELKANKDEGQNNVPSPVDISRKKEAREDDTEGAVRNEEDGKWWVDEATYIEEEPWLGDLHSMWSGYQPGV